jgi:hypothetical protein
VQTSDQARLARVVRYVAALLVIELALFALARLAPAMATLFRPAYFVVAALFAVPIWHASRARSPGHDRRQEDRRGQDD